MVLAEKKGNTTNDFISQIKNNTPLLKDKTLLVSIDDLDEGVTEEDIKKKYPFDLKVVSEDEIQDAFIDKNPKTAVMHLIPTEVGDGTIFAKVVVDTYEAKTYYFDYVSTGPTINNIHLGGKNNFKLKPKNFAELGKKG